MLLAAWGPGRPQGHQGMPLHWFHCHPPDAFRGPALHRAPHALPAHRDGARARHLPGIRRQPGYRPGVPGFRCRTGRVARRLRPAARADPPGRSGRRDRGVLRPPAAGHRRLPERGRNEAPVRAQGLPRIRPRTATGGGHAGRGPAGGIRLRAPGHAGWHGVRAGPLRRPGFRGNPALLPQPHRRVALPQGRNRLRVRGPRTGLERFTRSRNVSGNAPHRRPYKGVRHDAATTPEGSVTRAQPRAWASSVSASLTSNLPGASMFSEATLPSLTSME